jgi:hypothetical protein
MLVIIPARHADELQNTVVTIDKAEKIAGSF